MITDVTSGSAAAAGGLSAGALVTKVDDQMIGSADALVAVVDSKVPGDHATLEFIDASGDLRTV